MELNVKLGMPYNISQYGDNEFWASYARLEKSLYRTYTRRYTLQAKQLITNGFCENFFGQDLIRYQLEKNSLLHINVVVSKNNIGFGCEEKFFYNMKRKVKWLKEYFSKTETFLLANDVVIGRKVQTFDANNDSEISLFLQLLGREESRYESQAREFLATCFLSQELNGHSLDYYVRDGSFCCEIKKISHTGTNTSINFPIPITKKKKIRSLVELFAQSEAGALFDPPLRPL
ncbi:MAG: hypothetical protein F2538_02605 [Actinobacteria bacterium]|uniref:Unannotated protein n=1 Tax=freshwater metagenome TaxID=449393 RepID=A0A6J6CJ94_9ZZZZ|nr:hypothetical protein [Actinomycetota bacterium]